MKKIVIATNNMHKVKEFKSLFPNGDYEIMSLKDIGYNKEIIEDGKTFEENAIIKARQVSLDLNVIAISDDSGSKKGKIYTDGKEWVENMSPSEYYAFSKRAYEYNHRND